MRFSKLTGQFCIGHALAEYLSSQLAATCPITRLAVVKPERLLVQIPKQVEGFDANIGSVQAALQETPVVLHCVGMHVAVHVFDRVIDYFVLVVSSESLIGKQLITEYCRASFHVLANRLLEFVAAPTIDMQSADTSVAFDQPEYYFLVHAASAVNPLGALALVHVARLAAYHAFVYFHFVRQLAALVILHSQPDAMEHEPCGFLSDLDRAGKLPRANPVLAVGEQPHSSQPLIQTERRILENSSSFNGELAALMALVALPAIVLFLKDYAVASTTRADNTVAPTPCYYVLTAINRIREVDDRSLKGSRFHDATEDNSAVWSC